MVTRPLCAAVMAILLCCSGIVKADPGNGRGGPPTGACCVYSASGDATCSVGYHNTCNRQRGTYRGNGTTCSPADICPPRPTGACCVYNDVGVAACSVVTREGCQGLRGAYRGNATVCTTSNICPARPTGACCTTATGGASVCSVITAAACKTRHGSFKGNNIACAPDGSCPPRGACCFASGRCAMTIEAVCMNAGGDWQTAGAACSPNPCPQPVRGACCFAHDNHAFCFVVSSAQCAQAGAVYQGDNVACTATLCPQPVVGACCIPAAGTVIAHCTIGSAAECTTAAGTYGGDSSTCRSANCPTTCACDYDHDGYLSPADFYQFFNAWLAGNGDYNNSGATDRQDLVDFYSCFQSAPTGCTRAPHHHDD